jgi:2-methylcitrate dehydratase PrpD
MGVTEELALWVAGAQFGDLPDASRDVVTRSMLDWIGCALTGSRHRAARIVRDFVEAEGGVGRARVVGTSLRTSSSYAALANGVAGHIDDFDDSGAHPSSYLMPTVLALGEETAASGASIMMAWAVGYEISARLAVGVRPDRGWHTTPLYGTVGAAVAAGRLLGLAHPQLVMAMGIAASQTSGVMRNFGTMTKAFHPGHAARNGVAAAKLALRGYTAADDIVEAQYGYLDCFGGAESDLAAVTRMLGRSWLLATKPPAIKAWPTCSSNHQVLTAIERFKADYDIDPAEVAQVDCYGATVPGRGSLQYATVTTPMQGKFSMEYNVAAAFIDGRVDLATFQEARFSRGDLQEFMQRVHRHHDREAERTDGPPRGRVVVQMANGSVHELTLGVRRTLTGDDVVIKFHENAQRVITAAAADRVVSLVSHLEQQSDVIELMDLITGNAPSAAS